MVIAERIFAVMVLGVSVTLFVIALRSLKRRFAMSRWRRIEGRVIEHSIYSRHKHHRPRFLVEYTVGARRLKTLCDSPTRAGYSRGDAAESALKKYPIGSTVLLYVHPVRAERAAIWLPELYIIAAMLIGAALFGIVAIAGLRAT